jgi:hypothetical protein
MLRRLYSNVVEAIQSCCRRYTAMLRRLYSYVVEAIQPFCGGYMCVFTYNNTTPTKVVLSCFGSLVGLWQLVATNQPPLFEIRGG